eukprot:Gb_15632 [translate_table: standard]
MGRLASLKEVKGFDGGRREEDGWKVDALRGMRSQKSSKQLSVDWAESPIEAAQSREFSRVDSLVKVIRGAVEGDGDAEFCRGERSAEYIGARGTCRPTEPLIEEVGRGEMGIMSMDVETS